MGNTLGCSMSDLAACRASLERRREARRQSNLALWRQADADARRIVAHLVETYQPAAVIQWGSVLSPERFGPMSDIDIAIDGDFDAATWFRMVGDAWGMTRFSVDVVDLRRIEPEFADIIRMKGKVVYERRAAAD